VPLDRPDLTVEAGEVFGFVGPNGAGKSTAIRLLFGDMRPTAGRAWIFGRVSTAPAWAAAAGKIYVSVLLAGLGIAGFARRDLRG
jgi:ABC-type multidrug transport system ATPase subunit